MASSREITAWRVTKTKHRTAAFDGEGARRFGSRWSSEGRRVVYAAESLALALLEVLVHADGALLPHYTAFPVRFDARVVEDGAESDLPEGWSGSPAPPALRRVGDEWIEAGRTPVLRVPSAVVPQSFNYLLNPRYPGFDAVVQVGEPLTLAIDQRLR